MKILLNNSPELNVANTTLITSDESNSISNYRQSFSLLTKMKKKLLYVLFFCFITNID